MKISKPNIVIKGDKSSIQFIFTEHLTPHILWFKLPSKFLNKQQISSASLLSVFIPALTLGKKLTIDGKISKKLFSNLETIIDIMMKWFPKKFVDPELDLEVDAVVQSRIRVNKNKKACFFTGGIDSMNTFLKHKDEIDYLIHVHKGIYLDTKDVNKFQNKEIENIRKFAKEFNVEVIEVSTNIRAFAMGKVNYTSQYHGSLFASIAILLSKDIGTFYFGSSHAYNGLTPYGSHPALDYLFEVEDMKFVHDGAEYTRIEKAKNISKFPEVFPYLHYGCEQEKCSKGQKCVRSMINLDLAGIRQQCPWANKHDYTADDIRNMGMAGYSDFSKAVENYKELKKHPDKRELMLATKEIIDKFIKEKANKLIFKL